MNHSQVQIDADRVALPDYRSHSPQIPSAGAPIGVARHRCQNFALLSGLRIPAYSEVPTIGRIEVS